MFHGQGGDGMMEMIHTIQANSIAYCKDYLSPTHGLTGSRHGFNAEEAELEGLHSTIKFIKRRITSFNCILMDSKLVADGVDSQLSKCLKD